MDSIGTTQEHQAVVVVGAGQAGLCAGHLLHQAGVPHVILDAADQLGASWRSRWDSLVLFTPARYSALPAGPFPGDPDRLPSKDEVADYLTGYAEQHELPVRLNSAVTAVTAQDGGGFRLETTTRTYHSEQVILATGPFQAPRIPPFAAALAPRVAQLHSSTYRNATQLPDGPVLVVGAANSGAQIAAELASTRTVHLSVGTAIPPLPRRVLGRDLFWWLDHLGALRLPVNSRPGLVVPRHDFLVGLSLRRLTREYAVHIVPRAVAADGAVMRLQGGGALEVAAVVWATGYRPNLDWVQIPVLDADGAPLHQRGITNVPGAYFLGLEWQHARGSSLIGWVHHDAQFVVQQVLSHARERAAGSDG